MTDESAITHIEVKLGSEGDAYYTAMYANGEAGPRSEGYRGRTPQEALANAREAAERDFPELAEQRKIRVLPD